MTVEAIKKFASDACTVIDAFQQMVNDQEKEISGLKEALNKKASETVVAEAAPKMTLNPELLNKAASAVHSLYGSPEKVTPQAIADAWSAKPELMLNVITKFASEIVTRANVSGTAIGEAINKKASEPVKNESADAIFRGKYNY